MPPGLAQTRTALGRLLAASLGNAREVLVGGCQVGSRAGCVPSGSCPRPLPSQVFSATKGGWESNTDAVEDVGVALTAAGELSSQQ